MNERKQPIVIGIAGGTGAGKTTIVSRICSSHRGDVSVLDLDSYYKDQGQRSRDERDRLNFDDPSALDHDLLLCHLQQLRAGRSIEKPVYSFATHTRTLESQTVHPQALLLVEGIFALCDPRIRELMDLKIYLHAEPDMRLIRRLRRDVAKRGRTVSSVVTQYLKSVRPMHDRHIEPTRQFADLIVDTTHSVDGEVMGVIENAIAEVELRLRAER